MDSKDASQSTSPKTVPDTKHSVQRVGGDLHLVKQLLDQSGNVLNVIATPMMVEFRLRDAFQILLGASALAVPVALTEEAWVLGAELPGWNLIGIVLISIVTVASSGYFIFYRGHLRGHEWEFVKRVVAVYVITFLVSAILLTVLQKCPWTTDPQAALGRVILVSFPACFSATVVDSIK